jgi:hypothetical protein
MKISRLAPLAFALLLAACSQVANSPITMEAQSIPVIGPGDALVAAAGDIAACGENRGAYARATAALISKVPEATVIALGDLAYWNGTEREFSGCYDKVWGAHKERTRPAPGNHDYGIYEARRFDAQPYFRYFGAKAGPSEDGYYSFDLGSWHIVSLNSMAGQVKAAPSMAEQVEWLKADLKATGQPCILAYWHHPLFSSGEHGDDRSDPGRKTRALWDVLSSYGADVIVNGHDHNYERFAPQTPAGALSPGGIREFVAGTGGIHLRGLGVKSKNSEAFLANNGTDHGVLLMTLHPNSYEWRFLRTDGTVGDQSTGPQACH